MVPQQDALHRYALIAFMAVLQLTAPVAVVHAAKFDENLKAPAAPSNDELRTKIHEYFDTYASVNAKSPAGVVRNKAAHAKWFDTQWRLQRAIDTKRDLGDLSEFGITPKGDGSYSIDIANFPQWSPLHTSLTRLLEPTLAEAYAPDLKARGFRDEDIDVIKAYTKRNRPDRTVDADKVSLSESFATKIQRRLARKERFESPQMLAYFYQSARIQAEADRAWTVGLLDSLDQQRQRILESYFTEQDSQGSMAIAPDDIEAATLWTGNAIASGEYFRMLENEKAKARDMEVSQ